MNDSKFNPGDMVKEDVLKEFNQNYRNYIENSLLLNLVYEILFDSPTGFTHSSSLSSISEQQTFDSSTNIEDKIRETFLKAYALTLADKSTELLEDIKTVEPLNIESRQYLVEKIENKLDNYFSDIDEHLGFCNFDSNSKWNLETDNEPDHFETEPETSQEKTLAKLEKLIEHLNKCDSQVEQLNNDINLKLDNCLSTSIEIMKNLKKILSEFRIKFYAYKNDKQYENELLTCDILLSKIESVRHELLHDLYSGDKAKSLALLRNQINFETMMVKEKKDQVENTLSMFKSFGKEFDSVLNTYLELKNNLEKKQWTLDKLNDETKYL